MLIKMFVMWHLTIDMISISIENDKVEQNKTDD